jgi:hypothetical protein
MMGWIARRLTRLCDEYIQVKGSCQNCKITVLAASPTTAF